MIELNKNEISTNDDEYNSTKDDAKEYNSMKYDIRFNTGIESSTHFDIKNILDVNYQNETTREGAIEEAIKYVPNNSKDYARNILQTLYSKIFVEKLIRYTELFDLKQDDALEMFVRFNSGGKPLRKAEITMSILEVYWPSAKTKFGELLVGSYEGFGSDFIIRTALMLYGDVVKSNINKKTADNLRDNWNSLKKTLINLEQLLKEFKVELSRFASSWNVLLPIIYYIYYNHDYRNNFTEIRAYLLRAVLFTYFQSGTTSKLQQMKTRIKENRYEITLDMLDQITDLRATEGKLEDVLNSEKGSRVVR